MSNKIIVDGNIVEEDWIPLKVSSEGFSFGFGLFETLKFQNQTPFFLREHYDRLVNSAGAISMTIPYSAEEIFNQSKVLFEANGVQSGMYKIVLARTGRGDCVVVYLRDSLEPLWPASVRLRLSPVIKSSKAFASNHKTLNYLENLLELRFAQQHGYDECLYCNESNFVTECATSNIFAFRDGLLKTPAVECGLLAGVIRGQVLRIASELGMRVEEGMLQPEECVEADELFITSSRKGIVGVSEIWTDRLKTFATVGSKLVGELGEQLRLAENASAELFNK